VSTALKKKEKLVKKIKDQFGIGEEEEEEVEEVEETQAPLALTQGLGEDIQEETEKEKEAEETPTKKRKAEATPAETPKGKKTGKPSPAKPSAPSRVSTRTQKEKEQEKLKEQEKESAAEPKKKKLRRKYVAAPASDDEEEDTSQFRVVSHKGPTIDNVCANLEKNADLNELKNIDFVKLSKEEQNKIENSIYAMMINFKMTTLELDNSIPKELYSLVENKWHYCLNVEK
jgi:hypothetical protein